jgi:N-acetylglucosamine-6-phosphate deacetylase
MKWHFRRRENHLEYIIGAKIITENMVLENYVLEFNEKFGRLIPENEFNKEDARVFDAEGLYLAPGLIDVHIHGSGGEDTMNGTSEALKTISSTIAKNGVTSFLATTMTMDWNKISGALEKVRECMGHEMPGAELLGAHMEGPFINCKYKGAQAAEYILPPDWELIKNYADIIKIVTIAPENPGAEDFIRESRKNGIVVSMGHTAASFEEAMTAIETGVSHCTHLFNAMTGLNHRTPGAAAAALTSDIFCELIADGIHVHTGLYELIKKAKGVDRITLITDCIEAGGMGDGNYALGGQPVVVRAGEARLKDGVLAGSVLNLNEGLFRFYKNTKAELHEVFRMASLNPAAELGIEDRKGSVASGKDADFFLMDDLFSVKATYLKGKQIFQTGKK